MQMTTTQYERLMEVLGRIADAMERSANATEHVIPYWDAAETRHQEALDDRDTKDLIAVEQARAAVRLYDELHPAETPR